MKAVPAIQAQMGSTKYYETKLTARELTSTVRPARELDQWASASIEERMQRDLNIKRIMEEIVPYLAKHPDRLFGSLIVLVPKGSLEFEPLTDVVGKVPGAYKSAVESMGFLTVEKGEHVALDGQHRLRALREVITSGDLLGEFQSKVGDDEVSVIVVEFESNEKTRRIFNKVNRNAKPTGRSDNILLSEDDGHAIVTRMLMDRDRDAPLAAIELDGKDQELVNWRSNTLSKRMKELTTISAVYETVQDILGLQKVLGLHDFADFDEKKTQVRPSAAELEEGYEVASEWWDKLLTKVDAFKDALVELDGVSDIRFADEPPYHHHTLLLRPVGQIAMVKGVIEAMSNSKGQLSLDEALNRINKLDWSAAPTSYWRDTIIRADGRMVARKEAYTVAAKLIAHLIGHEYEEAEQCKHLYEEWNGVRGRDVKTELAKIVDPDLKPEPLPDPVA